MSKRKRISGHEESTPALQTVSRRQTRSSTKAGLETDIVLQDESTSMTSERRVGNHQSKTEERAFANSKISPLGSKQISFTIPFKEGLIHCERRGVSGQPSLIFTHGAGGGLSNPAISLFADGFAEVLPIVIFQGTMNLASRVANFEAVSNHEVPDGKTALGGRSMGARAAVMLSARCPEKISGLVLASYPLVGAQNGDVRDEILVALPAEVDVLFISGSRDNMCDLETLRDVIKRMEANCWVVVVEGADHGMGLRAKSGGDVVRKQVGLLAAEWLNGRDTTKRNMSLSWDAENEEVMSSGWQAATLNS